MARLTPATRALAEALVQHHSANATLAMMRRSLSGQAPSLSYIKRLRKKWVGVDQAPATAAPPAPPRTAKIAAPQLSKPPRAPLTFDQQLARVAAGARLVAVPQFRRPDPDFTLGGVASASL